MSTRAQFYVTDDPYSFKLTYNELSKELTLSIRAGTESRAEIRFDSLRTRALCEFLRLAQEDKGGPLGSEPPPRP